MNLQQMLPPQPFSITKEQDMVANHMADAEAGSLTASFGIGSDSFHWGIADIVPPKNTTQVENPGDKVDKKRRKSKAFRKYEKQLQLNQGGRPVLVQTQQVDNSDYMDVDRSNWFV